MPEAVDIDRAADEIQVTVAHACSARDVRLVQLRLPSHATVHDALAVPELAAMCPLADRATLSVAIWGRRVPLRHVLESGDRVEVCRPLRVDPKTARRERFARQGARRAGLFSSRRSDQAAG